MNDQLCSGFDCASQHTADCLGTKLYEIYMSVLYFTPWEVRKGGPIMINRVVRGPEDHRSNVN